jgi:hypothetical protein
MMNDIAVVALFCSDVRTEKGGTETIVGIYPDRIKVPQFPGAFAQMAFYVRIHMLTTYRPAQVIARVIMPDGNELQRNEVGQDLIEQTRQATIERGAPYMGLIVKFQVAPLRIEQEGRIQILLTVDGEDIVAGALQCVASTPST